MNPVLRAQLLTRLEQANQVRTARAVLKADLGAGRVSLARTLRTPPDCAERMAVSELLLAAPALGAVTVDRVLTECRISPSSRVGKLTERQRLCILVCLRNRSPRRWQRWSKVAA